MDSVPEILHEIYARENECKSRNEDGKHDVDWFWRTLTGHMTAVMGRAVTPDPMV